MAAPIKLSELPIGAQAIVREFLKTGPAFLRACARWGLIAGTPVKLVRCAPLGDPLEIQVRGYHLTLRRSEADHVLVESV